MKRARVVIADDHNLVAELCKRLLEPEFEVAGAVLAQREMEKGRSPLV